MKLAAPRIAISALVLLSAGVCAGQSLGDVARQERERRSNLTHHAVVVTNEDLANDRIFPSAAKTESPATAAAASIVTPAVNTPLWGVAEQPGFSLGAYARILREQRRQREQQIELARKQQQAPIASTVRDVREEAISGARATSGFLIGGAPDPSDNGVDW